MGHLGSGEKLKVSGNVQAQMTHERGLWLNFATVFLKTLPPNELGWDCGPLSQYGLFSIRKKTKVDLSGNLQAAARSRVLHFFRT